MALQPSSIILAHFNPIKSIPKPLSLKSSVIDYKKHGPFQEPNSPCKSVSHAKRLSRNTCKFKTQ